MITVQVHYHNLLGRVVGIEQENVSMPAGPISDLLHILSSRHGQPLHGLLFSPNGLISSHLVIFVNDRLVMHDRLSTALADGDVIRLFIAVSGG